MDSPLRLVSKVRLLCPAAWAGAARSAITRTKKSFIMFAVVWWIC